MSIKHILIVAPFCSLPDEPGYNRFLFLAHSIATSRPDIAVSLVTSTFRHSDKTFRNLPELIKDLCFQIFLIDEPGYRTNISFSRAYSHSIFTRNFANWFPSYCKQFSIPDVVYCAYPLAGPIVFLSNFRRSSSFKLVVDIQDVWPESIKPAFPLFSFIPDRFFPFFWRADQVYSSADALVAVSKTYLDRALKVNPYVPNHVCFIGISFDFVFSQKSYIFPPDTINLVYLGTLGSSYDLSTLINGFNKLYKLDSRFRLHVLGDGPLMSWCQKIAGPAVKFYGLLPFHKAISIAKSASLLINPIRSSARQSITNKLSEYLAMSVPIVSSQRCPEVVDILSSVNSVYYRAGSCSSFVDSVRGLLGSNSPIHTDSSIRYRFDRDISYPILIDFICSL